MNWDHFFIGLAKYISTASKDPSTQVGAVIVNQSRRIVGTGYNGFPKGIKDDPIRYSDRPTKYKLIIHAEINAILNAVSDIKECTLYLWPFLSCSDCTKVIIQSGITRVVAPIVNDDTLNRWGDSFKSSLDTFNEAGVSVDLIEYK